MDGTGKDNYWMFSLIWKSREVHKIELRKRIEALKVRKGREEEKSW
jgi:hypothetical protein